MKHILVIDDDLFIRDLVSTKLSESYSVLTAATGKEGLEAAENKKPDLILLDLDLPDKHGIEVLKNIRSKPETASVPVIIFSNNEISTYKDEVSSLNVTNYIVKVNVDMSELKSYVDKILS